MPVPPQPRAPAAFGGTKLLGPISFQQPPSPRYPQKALRFSQGAAEICTTCMRLLLASERLPAVAKSREVRPLLCITRLPHGSAPHIPRFGRPKAIGRLLSQPAGALSPAASPSGSQGHREHSRGERNFPSRWTMSSMTKLAAAGVASDAACSTYGIAFFRFCSLFCQKILVACLILVSGNPKYIFFHTKESVIHQARALPSAPVLSSAVHPQRCRLPPTHGHLHAAPQPKPVRHEQLIPFSHRETATPSFHGIPRVSPAAALAQG